MKNSSEFSIIKRFQKKTVLLICILLISLDTINLFRFKLTAHSFFDMEVWFPFSLGIILIFIAVTKIGYKLEKIGFMFFGVAFMLDTLSHLLGYRYFLFYSIGVETLATFFFFFAKTGKIVSFLQNALQNKKL